MLLSTLLRHRKPGPRGVRRGPTTPPRARPSLEELESRTLLNTDLALGGTLSLNGNEPYIAVNPLNPRNIVVSEANQLRISNDLGLSFPLLVNSPLPSGSEPTTGRSYSLYSLNGDDVVAFDAQGRLFWSYLIGFDANGNGTFPDLGDDLSVVVQQVNPTTGALIGPAVDVTTGDALDDKPWLAADANPSSPLANNLYLDWTQFGGIFGGEPSVIMFASSTNQGLTWSGLPAPSRSREISGGLGISQPAHVAVAANGDVYAAWHFLSGVALKRSGDGGRTWTGESRPFDILQAEVKDNRFEPLPIPGFQFWTQGALAAYVLTDPVRPGNVYVIANNNPFLPFDVDEGDVVLARSTDNGSTWQRTTLSHGPFGSFQVFPTGAIDQNGNLTVMWYDNRRGLTNASANFLLDVFATVSRDGGLTWSNDFRINDLPFDPDAGAPAAPFVSTPQIGRIGEYNGLAASNGIAYAAWTGSSFTGPTPTGQQVFFDEFSIQGPFPDRFEPNDAALIGVATDLGSAATYNETGLTIHSTADQDYFKVVALNTGRLDIQIEYDSLLSDLDVQALTDTGAVIQTALTGLDSDLVENLSIPVVQGRIYYVRVFAEPRQQAPINTYTLTVVNTPLPVVCGVDLATGSDSGRSDNDNVTNRRTVTFDITCPGLDQFLPLQNGGTLTISLELFNGNTALGIASYAGGSHWTLTTEPGGLREGHDNLITADVLLRDLVTGAADRGSSSPPLQITLDTTPPRPPTIALDPATSRLGGEGGGGMIVTGDSGATFVGRAEADAIVRLFASGVFDGLTVAGPADGDEVFPNGQWRWGGIHNLNDRTFFPFDGVRNMTATAEDLAGNISSTGMFAFLLDTASQGSLNQRFVAQVYRDLLRRHPDPGGLAAWTDLLDRGVSRVDVVRQFQTSPEYRNRVGQELYLTYLGRAADRGGLSFFASLLGSSPVQQAEAVMIGTGEYFTRAGGTNDAWVTQVYRDVLGRAPDRMGAAAWNAALAAGTPRSAVALMVLGSEEALRRRVSGLYQRFLHRDADSVGLRDFVAALQRGTAVPDVIAALLASQEYFDRL